MLKNLKDEARGWELQASNHQDQLTRLHLDYQADHKSKEIIIEERKESFEKLNTQVETLEGKKKRSEEDHSRQIAEKDQELEIARRDRNRLKEVNTQLQENINQKTLFENEDKKALEDAQTEQNRLVKAYRLLYESMDSRIAAGAEKDRQISDLGGQLQSGNTVLMKISAENAEPDNTIRKMVSELIEQLHDTRSSLAQKDGGGRIWQGRGLR